MANEVPGVINANEVYTLPEMKRRLGLGGHALRQAKKRGLPILIIGRKGYVRGSDVMSYLERMAQATAGV